MVDDVLLGPLAALAGALLTVGALYRLLLQYLEDLRGQRDAAMTGWREQTEETKRNTELAQKIAASLEKLISMGEAEAKEREFRRRIGDGSAKES